MSLIMEDFKPSVNTLEEVKKLQELVRKLELQNLHLRNKQNIPRKRSVSPVKDVKSRNSARSTRKTSDAMGDLNNESNVENSVCVNKDEYFDNLEIIRVSDIEMSDDESWLYTSPKSAKQEQAVESPYKWLRKDVDDPENKQLQLAKKALLTKLNELEILSPPIKMTTHHAENPVVSNLRRSQMMYKTPLSAQNHDNTHVDTRTFTRSKKKQAIEFLERLDSLNIEKSEKTYTVQLHRRGSDVSSDSVSSCHILEDANDVQEVARMQEESLRMSSPLGTPKRSSTKLGTYRRSLPNLNREQLALRQSKSKVCSDTTNQIQSQVRGGVVGRKSDSQVHSVQKTRREVKSPSRVKQYNQMSVQQPVYQSPENSEPTTIVPKSADSAERMRARSGLPRPSRASSASRSVNR
ncbi:unnamed protein product [Larinioides sclopetarius]|uniref:Uncharacterized protein n=1 Tax=Larinioides sclopetarius TaxID=280406 RepID=A0AAV2BSA7_9ARAC